MLGIQNFIQNSLAIAEDVAMETESPEPGYTNQWQDYTSEPPDQGTRVNMWVILPFYFEIILDLEKSGIKIKVLSLKVVGEATGLAETAQGKSKQ